LAQLRPMDGKDALAAEAAARLAGLAVFDWDWQTALTLVDPIPDTGSRLPLLIRCISLTMAGRSAEARNLLDTVRAAAAPGSDSVPERLARAFAGAWSDDLGAARNDLEAIVGRADGFGGSLRSAALWLLADVYYRLGAFDDATVTAELARAVLQDTGRDKSPEMAMACAVAAHAASARGDWGGARSHVAAVQARATGSASRFERACAAATRWSLAVAIDDPPGMLEAARALEAAAGTPELSVFPFGPVLAEALWRNRKLDEAAAGLAVYEARARQLGRVSAMAGACRVRGLLEASRDDAGAALRAFEEAASLAGRLPQPLEAARLMTAHGAVLARFGSRAAAIARVAEARGILERIGARPYLQRADELLRRLGRPGHEPRTVELTASESVVARLVASGLSNKQAAERLMVSVKAVEYHLGNIYAKLGVSSRSQLAARRDLPPAQATE
ncbi:MAG: helix-turn-helix transcriptional regulator, partial [Streptosporangiaceae bacterium]